MNKANGTRKSIAMQDPMSRDEFSNNSMISKTIDRIPIYQVPLLSILHKRLFSLSLN